MKEVDAAKHREIAEYYRQQAEDALGVALSHLRVIVSDKSKEQQVVLAREFDHVKAARVT